MNGMEFGVKHLGPVAEVTASFVKLGELVVAAVVCGLSAAYGAGV